MTLVPVVLIEQRDKHVHAQQRPRRSDAQIIANLVDDLVGDHRPAGRGRPEPVPLARPPRRRPAVAPPPLAGKAPRSSSETNCCHRLALLRRERLAACSRRRRFQGDTHGSSSIGPRRPLSPGRWPRYSLRLRRHSPLLGLMLSPSPGTKRRPARRPSTLPRRSAACDAERDHRLAGSAVCQQIDHLQGPETGLDLRCRSATGRITAPTACGKSR